MIKTSSDLCMFSAIFGKCLEMFVWPSDKFWKIFENFGKWLEIFGKSPQTLLCIVAWRSEINLLVLKNISLQHLKINFIPPRNHVLSSINYIFSFLSDKG